MIEAITRTHLMAVTGREAFVEVPAETPEEYIVIEKTGSAERNLIKTATLAIQSYAMHMQEAAALNEAVKRAMVSMTGRSDVSSVKLNSDYNYTDTETEQYRYQAVFDIVYYD